MDRAVTVAAAAQLRRGKPSRTERLSLDERLAALDAIAQSYPEAERYFRSARSIQPALREVRALPADWAPRGATSLSSGSASGSARAASAAPGQVLDLAWPSDYTCYLPALDERYARARENHTASARLFRHVGAPRPAAVLIHGYLGGHFPTEERVWPVRWLFRKGLNVALFVLPFHGVRRAAERRGPPPFPGSDPRMTNEGFRQGMADARDLIGWLRGGAGAADAPQGPASAPVGVMGMSLGGYSTALLATLEPELAFAVPLIPLASLADFARDQGRLGGTEAERRLQHAALARAGRVVSPLERRLVMPRERVLVIGAEADRITPIAHAEQLARHFDAPLESWPGGHLLQLGRSEAFRSVGRLLDELGVTHS
ncbi:MAG: hypothetical protein KF915_09570 [Polyangiaceae bacterium]|nr:hypothetical protein [Polyangiaceae bacterium]